VTGWTDTQLGDMITLKRGYDLPKRARSEGAVPIVSSSGPTGFHNEAKADPPGVVTGRYGTLGKVFYVDVPYWPLNTTLYVQDFKGNHERFVGYFLESMGLERYDGAAAVPGLDRNVVHRLPVRWPARPLQERIAAVLAAYDELIKSNLRRIEILEEMTQAIYREWFVNFRFPGHENATLVDTPLGPIPEGWTIHRLDQISDLHRGRSYRTL
jgi:type I restriction enzyme S subunit